MVDEAINSLLVGAALFAAFVAATLWLWRNFDHRADRRLAAALMAMQPVNPRRFDPAMTADLPEPARRYFQFIIRPGTPLYTVAKIEMKGQFSLGTKQAPNYLTMMARQVLAAPTGFIWSMAARNGLMRVSGSDAASDREAWTRFWLLELLPVARMSGTDDHRRSAFGRYVAEAVFWTPAALLPSAETIWEKTSETTARVTVHHDGMEQSVDVTVDADGRPLEVAFPRWSNANSKKTFRLQPFGGFLSEFREFSGFRLPTHIEGGNLFGTDDYFPFFIVDVTAISFPSQTEANR